MEQVIEKGFTTQVSFPLNSSHRLEPCKDVEVRQVIRAHGSESVSLPSLRYLHSMPSGDYKFNI